MLAIDPPLLLRTVRVVGPGPIEGRLPALLLYCRPSVRQPELRPAVTPVGNEFGVFTASDQPAAQAIGVQQRSEEHTSELQSLMRISYAVFCLKKKKKKKLTRH